MKQRTPDSTSTPPAGAESRPLVPSRRGEAAVFDHGFRNAEAPPGQAQAIAPGILLVLLHAMSPLHV
jgi:hypothetical protein